MEEEKKDPIFRPKARIIPSIGADSIKDNYAAIIELIKNSYDADAHLVKLFFYKVLINNQEMIKIIIEDNGKGMSVETVKNSWLVPATDDKLSGERKSGLGRTFLGRKGIGRFSASILGNTLQLVTFHGNQRTEINLDWTLFDATKYLDEVKIGIIETTEVHSNGTIFTILSDDMNSWKEENFTFLVKELRKLMTPIKQDEDGAEDDTFDVQLFIDPALSTMYSLPEEAPFEIKPFPILDFYTYGIMGELKDNKLSFFFFNSLDQTEREFSFTINNNDKINDASCGNFDFEFRIFDRDLERLNEISSSDAFKKPKDKKPSNDEIRKLLDEICGVYIYRDKFRIRPYGDEGYDWLGLDKRRVDDPSTRLGTNQVFGLINISSEEDSGLYPPTSRDGLKDNDNFKTFKKIMLTVIANIETARRTIRVNTGIGLKKSKHIFLQNKLEKLVSMATVSDSINKELSSANVPKAVNENIQSIIDADAEEKIKIANELQKELAMYQGQATLGKIMNIIMHQVSKPLSWFINTQGNMKILKDEYIETNEASILEKMLSLASDYRTHSELLSDLFKKLDPLSSKTRGRETTVNVFNAIESVIEIFAKKLAKDNITIENKVDKKLNFFGWKIDLVMALTNLIDNSVYWLGQIEKPDKIISLYSEVDENNMLIFIENNGPEISKEDIKSEVIFEPGISNKIGGGTGLGLPIAGEAIQRNQGNLYVREHTGGAMFIIEFPLE